jgi:hypothetical protein
LGIESDHPVDSARWDAKAFPDPLDDFLRKIATNLLNLLEHGDKGSFFASILFKDLIHPIQIE